VRNCEFFWRAETGPTLAGVQVDLTGFETGTPTPAQRRTVQYVKENASELFKSGLAVGRKADRSQKTRNEINQGLPSRAPRRQLRHIGLSLKTEQWYSKTKT
jgi:hypothetical protein